MIDIRIMAHPMRKDNVFKTLRSLNLPPSVVSWDDRPAEKGGDAIYTARKAWTSPLPFNCTHRVVLQDDILLCNNFLEYVELAAKEQPNAYVSFFHKQLYSGENKYEKATHSMGQALMLPAHLIPSAWEWIDNFIESNKDTKSIQLKSMMRADTVMLSEWAKNNNIPILHHVPSLVQHLGDLSLVGIQSKRIAPDFSMNPNIPLE